ncbi:hypothetical protein BU17DRAFT_84724 [Hysterangium stoloniferum]|nr:hypothetical protein BU17DRAFT_84724 [Hysterangium stoloniferum]
MPPTPKSDTRHLRQDNNAPYTEKKGPEQVSLACLPCRQKKKKCDGLKPTCANCARKLRDCTYDGPETWGPTRRARLRTQQLATEIEAYQEEVQRLKQELHVAQTALHQALQLVAIALDIERGESRVVTASNEPNSRLPNETVPTPPPYRDLSTMSPAVPESTSELDVQNILRYSSQEQTYESLELDMGE